MSKLTVYFLLSVAFVSCGSTNSRDYYLPENFNGDVAIVYTKENGSVPSLKDGREQIIIPDSGVVFIKGKYREGSIDYQYFIKTKNCYSRLQRNEHRVSDSHEQQVFMDRVVIFSFPRKMNLTDSASFTAELFYVGTKLDSAVARRGMLFEDHISQLTRKLIK